MGTKRKTIGGAPAFAIKLLLAIAVVGIVAGLLSGCGAPSMYEQPDDEATPVATEEVSEDSTFVQVPGTKRGGNVFDFSYTTAKGTTVTCIVYDRSGDPEQSYRQGAGGPFCFEEGENGGMIAPLPRPER